MTQKATPRCILQFPTIMWEQWLHCWPTPQSILTYKMLMATLLSTLLRCTAIRSCMSCYLWMAGWTPPFGIRYFFLLGCGECTNGCDCVVERANCKRFNEIQGIDRHWYCFQLSSQLKAPPIMCFIDCVCIYIWQVTQRTPLQLHRIPHQQIKVA